MLRNIVMCYCLNWILSLCSLSLKTRITTFQLLRTWKMYTLSKPNTWLHSKPAESSAHIKILIYRHYLLSSQTCDHRLHESVKDKTRPVQAVNTQDELEDTMQPAVLAVSEPEIQFLVVVLAAVNHGCKLKVIFITHFNMSVYCRVQSLSVGS